MDKYFKLFSHYPDISAEDQSVLEAWFIQNGHGDIWKEISSEERILGEMRDVAALDQRKQEYWKYLWEQKIGIAAEEDAPKTGVIGIYQYVAAASILLALSTIVLWWYYQQQPKQVALVPTPQTETKVVPGSYKAKLTLADGSVVILDSAALGKLTTQGATSIENKKGQLVYDGKKGVGPEKVLFNTLTTGRGESYSVVLADGTKVWLNAASSVHYPLNFPGTERKVTIEGEAYFEVAKNPHQPFIVLVNGMEIKVTGTIFNVNAYTEAKAITTTLLEGQVQLTSQAHTEVLAPGQQGALLASGALQVRKAPDRDKVVGWQKGLFVFDRDDVETVMNELARWYDVRVVYKGTIKDLFTGVIRRSVPLDVLLVTLEKSTVHFKVEDRTIIVSP